MSEDIKGACVCGSLIAAKDCCQPLLFGDQVAATAEALMRSRYSAFVKQNAEYLMLSHHESTRPDDGYKASGFDGVKWFSLQVLDTKKGLSDDVEGIVEFKAFLSQKDQTETLQLHERSRFVKEDGRWFYLDCEFSKTAAIDLGRNEKCWCGSQKKFKKCHA